MIPSQPAIFEKWEPKFHEKGFACIPTRGKKPAERNWAKVSALSEQMRFKRRRQYSDCNIGVLAGTDLKTGAKFGFVDVDHPGLVEFVKAVLDGVTAGKVGSKGATFFFQTHLKKSRRLRAYRGNKPAVELFLGSGQTVCPPSVHPDGYIYKWWPQSLLEVEHDALPLLDEKKFALIESLVGNPNALGIVEGGADGKNHDLMLSLTSCGIAHLTEDLDWLAACLNSLLPVGYAGNTAEETLNMLQSAKKKFPATVGSDSKAYEPGALGPIPLGYAGGEFIFRNQQTKEVVRKSSQALVSPAGLFELAPKEFWQTVSPKINKEGAVYGIDYLDACSRLIQACRRAGAMDVSRIRGIGVWPENGRLVTNLGGEEILSPSFIYTAPKKLDLIRGPVQIETILEFLRKPEWVTPCAPELLMGWAFASVICGSLVWRPHAGLTGPAAAGKSTVMRGITQILSPLAIQREGISTEAGIRQTIGYDARPVLLDELEPESSRDRARVERIIKFIRSNSSAEGAVARGTPDGKALTFTARAMFLIGAINLYRISAADTSRLVKFEMQRIDPERGRKTGSEVRELIVKLTGTGPAFCQMAIDGAEAMLASIPLLHRAIPVVQERQADNLATLLAGYWVALNRRAIRRDEVAAFAEPFTAAVQDQREGLELDDATECLNALLGHSAMVERTGTRDDGAEFVVRETYTLGSVMGLVMLNRDVYEYSATLNQFGIKFDGEGFLIANSHPALQGVYRGTRWEGGLWGSALARVDDARREKQRRFADGVRSLAVWIPQKHIPPPYER